MTTTVTSSEFASQTGMSVPVNTRSNADSVAGCGMGDNGPALLHRVGQREPGDHAVRRKGT
ncbi:hypothetical protein [Nonomuraea rubra]|uniref:hypothetical protein n=1 Tax=Nonomuraea rubra TaxID=46180 RepID=UPI0033C974B2